ncbi:MAG TPA: hypothetical protein PLQ81_11055 [bacterium]|nr:hypothetical protein [bacterium]
MKRFLLYLAVALTFCLTENPVFSQIRDITLLNEYRFIPNKILNSVDFYDLYKTPEIALGLTVFQNEFDRKKSSGYFGFNFNSDFSFKALSVDGSAIPEFVLECSLDNFEKFKAIIETLTMSGLTVGKVADKPDLYAIKSNPAEPNEKFKDVFFPFLLINKKTFFYGDIMSFIASDKTPDILKEKKTTVKEKTERAFELLNELAKNPSDYAALKYVDGKVNLNSADMLFYMFTNISVSYLNNLYSTFNLDFLKRFLENNSFEKQALVIRKQPRKLEIESYIFNKKKVDPEAERGNFLNLESPINELIEKNIFAYIAVSGDVSAIKKAVSERNIEPEILKEYILKTIGGFEKNLIFYIGSIENAPSLDLAGAFKNAGQYPAVLLFETSSPEKLIEAMDNIAGLYPDSIEVKNDGVARTVSIKTDSGTVDFYSDFIENGGTKYMILTASKKELNRLKISTAGTASGATPESANFSEFKSFASLLNEKKIEHQDKANSFYYLDLKQAVKYARKELSNMKIVSNNSVLDYLSDKYGNLRGFIKNENDIVYQNILIETVKNIDFVQIFNILKKGQNQPQTNNKNIR